jgi:fatty-acid desaturase
VPEETYIVSHHVHHAYAEQPGDPYNANAGPLYCFLADTNHQPIARDLPAADYQRVVRMLDHTGIHTNSHEKYRFWGSVTHPLHLSLQFILNWAFWYGAFYLLGGHALACAIFGGAFVWAVGIRTYNFAGHGSGKDRRREGVDFNRADRSVNQLWPGFVAGEWHNNHHLYRRSARTGFLPYQLDLAWFVIRIMKALGGVHGVHDDRERFLREHYEPYRRARNLARAEASAEGYVPPPSVSPGHI